MNFIKSKKQMYIVIGVFALILLLGTTTYGPWLETPRAFDYNNVWRVDVGYRNVNSLDANNTNSGARPAIDVPYGRISY